MRALSLGAATGYSYDYGSAAQKCRLDGTDS
jgi:hypothetical protein